MIGFTTGDVAGRSGVTVGDRIELATLVGKIGASVGTGLLASDKERVGTASVSAGSIAATGGVSAGIRLWTTGDRTGISVETTGEIKDATGDRTRSNGTSNDEASGTGL